MQTRRQARVDSAKTLAARHLFPYMGHIGAYLLVGGVDIKGPQLYYIHAHGNYALLPYATFGSGSLASMQILEAGYKDNMTEEACKLLCIEACKAGPLHDLGSGSSVDCLVIKKDGSVFTRGVWKIMDSCISE